MAQFAGAKLSKISQSRIYNKGISMSPRAQSWLVLIIVAVSLVFLAGYIVPYIFNVVEVPSVSEMVINNKEGFQERPESQNTQQNALDSVKKARTAIAALPEADQRRVCASTVSLVTAYRSLFTGAAFKLQESSEGSGEFFLYGPDMRVVEVSADGSGALSLAIRNENPERQLFVREIAVKQMDGSDIAAGGETCYVFTPKTDSNMALQYEHEHLTLRPLTRAPSSSSNSIGAPRPFIGQCFIRFQATEDELNKQALATGLGIAQLADHHLGQGGQSHSTSGNNTSSARNNNSNLDDMTRQIEEQARTPAVRDYAEYQNQTGGPGSEVGANGNPFANKPIQVNLNLGAAMARDGFSADADGSASRNPASSGATSVRALLDKYTARQLGNQPPTQVSDKEMAINKAYRAAMSDASGVGGVSRQPVGCPSIDPSLYYTERQLAQCAGCTPDDFLRGKL